MKIQEIWGIPHTRIQAFFLSQSDIRESGEVFFFGECEIRLTALPARMAGPLRFPRTQVEFDGPEQEAEAIHHRFVLQFISAGA